MLRTGVYLQGRYEILGLIGSGGMSDVYKAKCHKLNRLVAIKVLKKEFSNDDGFVGKFQMEAQAAAGLSHPNIVNVYDVVDEDDLHGIVMELVEGITLKSYIAKKGMLDVKEAVGIAIQVAQGIEAAHEQNIIHRDIKPQNMLISKEGKVKVADFGIARAATTQTMTSEAMGSVHYISPEQARGGYSDARSDIYSLGITIYEMVTGQLPFKGENTVAVAIAQLQEPIPRPSLINPEIPVSLESIILKCTEKKPERRYAQMTEVMADLRRVLVYPDEDFVQPAPEVDLGAGTVIIGKEELKEIKRGAEGPREWEDEPGTGEDNGAWDPLSQRAEGADSGWDGSGEAAGLEPGWNGPGGREAGSGQNWDDRDSGPVQDWDGRDSGSGQDWNGRESGSYRNWDDMDDGRGEWSRQDDRDMDWEDSRDRDGMSARNNMRDRDYRRGRDGAGERGSRRDWEWEDEDEWEDERGRSRQGSRNSREPGRKNKASGFEKLLTVLGVLAAILIVAILVMVFSRLGGLFRFSSDESSEDIQTEIVATTEPLSDMEVAVPDVLELPIDMAEAKLKESTLVMKVSGYEDSDTVPKGSVISQHLPKGTVVQKYSAINVVVSNGSDIVKLSEMALNGMTGEAAKALLEQNKLVVESMEEYHDTVSEGAVIRFEPQEARPGQTVYLYISAGPASAMKTVPKITEMLAEDAIARLTEAGLNPGDVTEEFSDTVGEGFVISQGVEAEMKLKEGSVVPFVVSAGPEIKRYVAAINEVYSLAGSGVGPGAMASDKRVSIRLKQSVNGQTVYTTLMEPAVYRGDSQVFVSFTNIEGASGVDSGDVEVVDADTGVVLATYPVRFTQMEWEASTE